MAVVAGGFAFGIASFVTSTCNAPPADVASKISDLRLAIVVIGCVVSLAPAGWAFLARRLKVAAPPWVAVAVIMLVVTVVSAVGTNQTSQFCVF